MGAARQLIAELEQENLDLRQDIDMRDESRACYWAFHQFVRHEVKPRYGMLMGLLIESAALRIWQHSNKSVRKRGYAGVVPNLVVQNIVRQPNGPQQVPYSDAQARKYLAALVKHGVIAKTMDADGEVAWVIPMLNREWMEQRDKHRRQKRAEAQRARRYFKRIGEEPKKVAAEGSPPLSEGMLKANDSSLSSVKPLILQASPPQEGKRAAPAAQPSQATCNLLGRDLPPDNASSETQTKGQQETMGPAGEQPAGVSAASGCSHPAPSLALAGSPTPQPTSVQYANSDQAGPDLPSRCAAPDPLIAPEQIVTGPSPAEGHGMDWMHKPRIVRADFSPMKHFNLTMTSSDTREHAICQVPYGDKTIPFAYHGRAANKFLIVENGAALTWPIATLRRTATELWQASQGRAWLNQDLDDLSFVAKRVRQVDDGFDGFAIDLSDQHGQHRELRVPWCRYPALFGALPWERAEMVIMDSGECIGWPELELAFRVDLLISHAKARGGC